MKTIALAAAAMIAVSGAAFAQESGNFGNKSYASSGSFERNQAPRTRVSRGFGLDRLFTGSVNRSRIERNRNRNRYNGLYGNYSGNVLERDVYTGQ